MLFGMSVTGWRIMQSMCPTIWLDHFMGRWEFGRVKILLFQLCKEVEYHQLHKVWWQLLDFQLLSIRWMVQHICHPTYRCWLEQNITQLPVVDKCKWLRIIWLVSITFVRWQHVYSSVLWNGPEISLAFQSCKSPIKWPCFDWSGRNYLC